MAETATTASDKFNFGFFDDLIGQYVHVDCSSWPADFAQRTWGPAFKSLKTKGEIRQVKLSRRKGVSEPVFNISFEDNNQTYTNLDLDYVFRGYASKIPLSQGRVHSLKSSRGFISK
jgi:hypothetical protein